MESFLILLVIVLGSFCTVHALASNAANHRWRAECVRRGVAEWVILDEHGNKEWRWKDGK